MQREPVQSSNIRSVGYDLDEQLLEIEFENGKIYQYFAVPADLYDRLMKAPSKGRILNAHIKDHFRCSQVR